MEVPVEKLGLTLLNAAVVNSMMENTANGTNAWIVMFTRIAILAAANADLATREVGLKEIANKRLRATPVP